MIAFVLLAVPPLIALTVIGEGWGFIAAAGSLLLAWLLAVLLSD